MADFQKAYDITASWEGKWSKIPEKSNNPVCDREENYNCTWWGTNYGLTGRFMRDFAGWLPTQRLQFQNMTKAQCGEIWRKTRWTWGKFEEINDQEIANLLFDWGVRRWNSLSVGVAQAFNVNVTDITRKVNNIDMGGKPPSKTDKFLIFNDYAIQLINNNPNPQLLHAILKAKRAELDNVKKAAESIRYRYASFTYTGTNSKDVFMSSVNTKKRSLAIQEKKESTEGVGVLGKIAIGFAVGKLLKIF